VSRYTESVTTTYVKALLTDIQAWHRPSARSVPAFLPQSKPRSTWPGNKRTATVTSPHNYALSTFITTLVNWSEMSYDVQQFHCSKDENQAVQWQSIFSRLTGDLKLNPWAHQVSRQHSPFQTLTQNTFLTFSTEFIILITMRLLF